MGRCVEDEKMYRPSSVLCFELAGMVVLMIVLIVDGFCSQWYKPRTEFPKEV